MLKNIEAIKHLTANQKKELEEYANGLVESMEGAGLGKEEIKEKCEIMVEYQANLLAAERLRGQHNSFLKKVEHYAALYKNEADDEKAQEYLSKVNEFNKKIEMASKKYDIFEKKRSDLESAAVQTNEYINKLTKTKEKQPQNRTTVKK